MALPDYPVESFIMGGGIQAGKAVAGTAVKSIVGGAEKAAAEATISSGQNSTVRSTSDTLLPEADFTGRGVMRADLADHLAYPSISGRQIAGGHDINEFNVALNKAGGTVVSKVETGPGIYEIKYLMPNSNKPSLKTVFDPAQYSNMEIMANTAANRALLEYALTGNAAPIIKVNGINFDVRIAVRLGEPPAVRTVFPVGSAK